MHVGPVLVLEDTVPVKGYLCSAPCPAESLERGVLIVQYLTSRELVEEGVQQNCVPNHSRGHGRRVINQKIFNHDILPIRDKSGVSNDLTVEGIKQPLSLF